MVYLEQDSYASNDSLLVNELEEKISDALSTIPQKCKRIFELSRFDGFKYKEIALALNISVRTVKGQISKVLKIFMFELKDYLVILISILFSNNK